MRKMTTASLLFVSLFGLPVLATQTSSQESAQPVNQERPARITLAWNSRVRMQTIQKVQPIYPAEARAARVQGRVVLDVVVGLDGSVVSVEPKRALDVRLTAEEMAGRGHPTDDPMLVQAATESVKQWKYPPSVFNGQPVEVEMEVNVTFSLGN